MTHTLHPCPFCGGSGIKIHAAAVSGEDGWIAQPDCIDCGASGPQAEGSGWEDAEKAAAAAWNERRIMPKWSVMRRLAEDVAFKDQLQ